MGNGKERRPTLEDPTHMKERSCGMMDLDTEMSKPKYNGHIPQLWSSVHMPMSGVLKHADLGYKNGKER